MLGVLTDRPPWNRSLLRRSASRFRAPQPRCSWVERSEARYQRNAPRPPRHPERELICLPKRCRNGGIHVHRLDHTRWRVVREDESAGRATSTVRPSSEAIAVTDPLVRDQRRQEVPARVAAIVVDERPQSSPVVPPGIACRHRDHPLKRAGAPEGRSQHRFAEGIRQKASRRQTRGSGF